MARGKDHRAKQRAIDSVDVVLPRLGDAPSISVVMKVNTTRKNGCDPIWFKLDGDVLTYLARAFDHVLTTDGACIAKDEHESNDHEDETNDADVGEGINDNDGDGCSDDNVDKQGLQGDVGRVIQVSEPALSTPIRPCVGASLQQSSEQKASKFRSTTLFAAFQKAAVV